MPDASRLVVVESWSVSISIRDSYREGRNARHPQRKDAAYYHAYTDLYVGVCVPPSLIFSAVNRRGCRVGGEIFLNMNRRIGVGLCSFLCGEIHNLYNLNSISASNILHTHLVYCWSHVLLNLFLHVSVLWFCYDLLYCSICVINVLTYAPHLSLHDTIKLYFGTLSIV
jgi:hypothetical protein